MLTPLLRLLMCLAVPAAILLPALAVEGGRKPTQPALSVWSGGSGTTVLRH